MRDGQPDLISLQFPYISQESSYISLYQGYVSDDQPDLMAELGKPGYPDPHPDPNPSPDPNPDLTLTLTLTRTATLTRNPTLTRQALWWRQEDEGAERRAGALREIQRSAPSPPPQPCRNVWCSP